MESPHPRTRRPHLGARPRLATSYETGGSKVRQSRTMSDCDCIAGPVVAGPVSSRDASTYSSESRLLPS